MSQPATPPTIPLALPAVYGPDQIEAAIRWVEFLRRTAGSPAAGSVEAWTILSCVQRAWPVAAEAE